MWAQLGPILIHKAGIKVLALLYSLLDALGKSAFNVIEFVGYIQFL